jgi:hypothetical protein
MMGGIREILGGNKVDIRRDITNETVQRWLALIKINDIEI